MSSTLLSNPPCEGGIRGDFAITPNSIIGTKLSDKRRGAKTESFRATLSRVAARQQNTPLMKKAPPGRPQPARRSVKGRRLNVAGSKLEFFTACLDPPSK